MSIAPKKYALLLLDKDNNMKFRLENFVPDVAWDWLAEGGCGQCRIKAEGDALRFDPAADDKLQIWLPIGSGDAVNAYTGYLESFSRDFDGKNQSINLEFNGYAGWFERVVVHDDVNEKVYESTETSAVAEDIVDNFLVPNSPVTKGTIEEGEFSPDLLSFKGYVSEVLKTLAVLQGRVVYGVGPDLNFYWYNEIDTVGNNNRWYFEDGITSLKSRTDFSAIKNDIFFEGGEVNGAVFASRRQSPGSQTAYGLHQDIQSQGSITTNAVAARYSRNILKSDGIPRRQVTVRRENINYRMESSLPFGPVEIIDADTYQHPIRYKNTSDAEIYGNGKVYGQTERFFIDRIRYSFSAEDGKLDAEYQFGDSLAVSRASTRMKRLQDEISTLRQRSL